MSIKTGIKTENLPQTEMTYKMRAVLNAFESDEWYSSFDLELPIIIGGLGRILLNLCKRGFLEREVGLSEETTPNINHCYRITALGKEIRVIKERLNDG